MKKYVWIIEASLENVSVNRNINEPFSIIIFSLMTMDAGIEEGSRKRKVVPDKLVR